MLITNLRKYRIQIDPNIKGFFINDNSEGVALLDLIGTGIIGYIIDNIFGISKILGISKLTYLMALLPLSVIVHLIFNINTYLIVQLSKGNIIYWSFYIIFLIVLIYSKLI